MNRRNFLSKAVMGLVGMVTGVAVIKNATACEGGGAGVEYTHIGTGSEKPVSYRGAEIIWDDPEKEWWTNQYHEKPNMILCTQDFHEAYQKALQNGH